MKKTCSKCGEDKSLDEFYIKDKKKGTYQSYCKPCLLTAQKQRWRLRKLDAIEHLGGVCADCGQQYPYQVYQFHHLTPGEKDFDWGKGRQMKWELVLEELDKCVLLCANCHILRHSSQLSDSEAKQLLEERNTRSVSLFLNREDTNECPVCKTLKSKNKKYCSKGCAAKDKQKVDWDSIDLVEHLKKHKGNISSAAKELGVSDNGLRKHLK
jgi:hypothetical protein